MIGKHSPHAGILEHVWSVMANGGSREIDTPIAIIGMAARAAGAPDPDALWRLVETGRNAIAEVPADRLPGFDPQRLGVPAPRAALLERIDTFDADFFGLSPRQAAFMDPRQRLLLEETWHALEDAAIAPDRLAGSDTGVFAGSAGADFRLRCDGLGAIDQYTAAGTLDAFLANRISHHFDLRGCSVVVDTACSAGLAAVAQAVSALAAGQVDLAVAAGAQVICHGFDQEAYVKAGILSPSGRVRSFSDESDGYVRGDGVAVAILKRLADAERDGDPIRAVIRGVAQCHDGRAGGQFSPDPDVQASLILRATRRAGVTPAALGYVEAHATGTRTGDRAEAIGLIMALNGQPAAAGPAGKLWVGAVKSVIGHTEGAAGLFGLVKAILVLENERIPAIPGFTGLMTDISLDRAPVAFPTQPVAWPREPGRPRMAGISSFGIGGANVHVVISEAPPPPEQYTAGPGPGSRIFPLSAASTAALSKLAAHFADWLENHPRANLDAVAWTLQSGRSALAYRTVLTGNDAASLARAAAAFGEGSGEPPPPNEAESLASATARIFLSGQDAKWAALWEGQVSPPRIRLVAYPFEPRSHWFRAERPPEPCPPRLEEPPPQRGQPAVRIPLVHLPPPGAYGLPGVMPPASHAPVSRQDSAVPVISAPPQVVPASAPVAAAPDAAPANAPTAVAAQTRPLEQIITDIATEVLYLGAGAIDPEQDFVAAGLDSVLAVEFVQLLRSRSGLALSVEQVHACRTARALARAMTSQKHEAPVPSVATEPQVPAAAATEPQVPAAAATEPQVPAAAATADLPPPPPAALVERLRQLAGECLYLPPDKVDPDAEFTAIGLDSVLAVEFVAKLNAGFSTGLTLATLYEQSTLNGLAVALAAQAAPARGEPQ